jgi:hypothetical protein
VKKFASLRKDIGTNSEAKCLGFKPYPDFQWGNNSHHTFERITQELMVEICTAQEESEGTSNRDDIQQ